MKTTDKKNDTAALRDQAEKLLKKGSVNTGSLLTVAESMKLLHELAVHQIELELQNQELTETRLTAEKEAEKYTELYDFAPIGYCTLTEEGEIRELNLSAASLLGKERVYLKEKRVVVFISEETRPQFNEFLRNVFVGDEKQMCEIELIQSGDSPKIVHIAGIISGNTKECFITMEDITQRKDSENAMLVAQKLESIGTLTGGIAHDFNNLLTAMIGNILLAKDRLPQEHPAAKNLDRAYAAMERAASLTKQMLAYSGKGKFQIVAVDVAKMVKDHVDLFEASLPKNVTIETKISPEPVVIKGDPGQIEQVVMNLIINAGEAVGEKPGRVNIDVSSITLSEQSLKAYGKLNGQKLKSGAYALFQVTDTGCGISADTLTKIFEPFYSTKFVGRGLGLSAVLGIVRGHKGGILVNSNDGAGTTFQVIFPLKRNNGETSDPPLPENAPARQSLKLLLIDDEEYIVDMTKDIIEQAKYEFLSAVDPALGIAIYEKEWRTIDAVILDYSMPKMNGKEVLVELRRINPDVKVLLSSGYSNEEIIHFMGDVKPNAVLQKPHSPKNLLSVLQKVMGEA